MKIEPRSDFRQAAAVFHALREIGLTAQQAAAVVSAARTSGTKAT